MKDFITKPENIKRIEFWAVTTLFVFSVFFQISYSMRINWTPQSGGVPRAPFDYYFIANIIRYTILYVTFLILNFKVVPKLIRREGLWQYIALTLIIYLLVGVAFGTTNTYLKYALLPNSGMDARTHNFTIQKSFLYALWLFLLFGFYTVIKYLGLHLLDRSESIHSRYRWITPGGVVAFVLWMISMFFLIVGDAEHDAIAVWSFIVPSGILFYWYSFYTLIPLALSKKKPFRAYMLRTFGILLVSILPVGLLVLLLIHHEDAAFAVGFLNGAVHLFVTAPLSWIIFKRYLQGNEEMKVLRKELGQTSANFDFLRSQINPHFLFNALNTIYGTALQERAERTSEGIEKLGDMMRFMLQENMQEQISLAREIEYLNNYISLQKLRTDPNPIITIEATVDHPLRPVQIAPMLLIPFVENAFKHGISFREPSHIKINLEMKEGTLYFDVYNSKHAKGENDPEKDKSGIGLVNVKQRLNLLYPGKHELIIRETGKEFFVHLTIQLS